MPVALVCSDEFHPTVERPEPGDDGYVLYVQVTRTPGYYAASAKEGEDAPPVHYLIGTPDSCSNMLPKSIRCGDFNDFRETIVDIGGTRFSAMVFALNTQRYIVVLPLVPEGACLIRHMLLRTTRYIEEHGVSICEDSAVSAPAVPFMDMYAKLSTIYFHTNWGRGPCCMRNVLDKRWAVQQKSLELAERRPLDWTSPMDILRAMLGRDSTDAHLELQALVASTVFTFGLSTTFSVLVELMREYNALPLGSRKNVPWIKNGKNVMETILTFLVRLSLAGEAGILMVFEEYVGVFQSHVCGAELELQKILNGEPTEGGKREAEHIDGRRGEAEHIDGRRGEKRGREEAKRARADEEEDEPLGV